MLKWQPSRLRGNGTEHAMNLFTNSIVALHLATGTLAWSYRPDHHDLWHYDWVTGHAFGLPRRGVVG